MLSAVSFPPSPFTSFPSVSWPFLPVGKISRAQEGWRLMPARPKLQNGPPGSAKIPARCSRDASARPSVRLPRRSAPRRMFAVFPHFPHRLSAVAAVAKALQIAPVAEPVPVALVIDDVVNVCSACPSPALCALAAKRLTHQLRRAQILSPLVGEVHPAPGLCFFAALVCSLWLVLLTVAIAHQLAAAWMPAWSERLQGHGLSPPGKTKSLHRHKPLSRFMWRRLKGAGANRYSRWSSSRNAYTFGGRSASPCRIRHRTATLLDRKQGRGAFHLSLSVYHFSHQYAISFPPLREVVRKYS